MDKFDYDDRWVEEEIALRIEDKEIQKFLRSWNDILPLVKSNTISRNLYNLWLKDEMQKYKIKTPAAKEQEEWESLLFDDDVPFMIDDETDQAEEPLSQETTQPQTDKDTPKQGDKE